jgi:hypothetical protein
VLPGKTDSVAGAKCANRTYFEEIADEAVFSDAILADKLGQLDEEWTHGCEWGSAGRAGS